ncbi:hypothetical protein I7I48_10360 [Histoplasma ohiense]|nr:hypothetical protein I7I48_10360 [Histoplasma ohiense (nom. inval.)]
MLLESIESFGSQKLNTHFKTRPFIKAKESFQGFNFLVWKNGFDIYSLCSFVVPPKVSLEDTKGCCSYSGGLKDSEFSQFKSFIHTSHLLTNPNKFLSCK